MSKKGDVYLGRCHSLAWFEPWLQSHKTSCGHAKAMHQVQVTMQPADYTHTHRELLTGNVRPMQTGDEFKQLAK